MSFIDLYTVAERYFCVSRFELTVRTSALCTWRFAVTPVSRSHFAVGATPSASMHFCTRHFAVHPVGSLPFADRQFALPHFRTSFAVSQLVVRCFTVGSLPFADRQFVLPHFVLRSSAPPCTTWQFRPACASFCSPLSHAFSWKDGLLDESE